MVLIYTGNFKLKCVSWILCSVNNTLPSVNFQLINWYTGVHFLKYLCCFAKLHEGFLPSEICSLPEKVSQPVSWNFTQTDDLDSC